MDFDSLQKLFGRATRLSQRLGVKEGNGTSWSVKFEDGEVHTYSIGGVKSPEEVEDDVEGMFIWLWSLKDHVKKFSETRDKSGKWVENEINADSYLAICGDIANRSKHGSYDRPSRSGESPKLGRLQYKIPQEALASIRVGAFDVGINVSNPKLVGLEMPILSNDDKYLGDAFKYLDYALKAWEKIIDRAEKAV